MDTNVVKQQVWALADELNSILGVPLIEPDQQSVKKENISLKGRKGERLYIKPATGGYLIGLSGDALAVRMTHFMERLAGELHGYGFPREKREPCWIVGAYEQVREAACYFAGVGLTKPSVESTTVNEEAFEAVSLELRAALVSIYEEMMWLAGRPNVTPSRARAWYTHVMAESVKLRVRQFTGLVSKAAAVGNGTGLRLEHYKRIQTTLTDLVGRHQKDGPNLEEFLRTLIGYEAVHIVTTEENYAAMRAKGDYQEAGIVLLPWTDVPSDRRRELWTTMLKGKVANAEQYHSTAE
ncbi:hypothetical protein [Burkholderia sp. F1]|uniref:hypothetical protein n=1 Tax=Burkholderia sp. F1 TaxID=3366817 RepID=UPI003D742A46